MKIKFTDNAEEEKQVPSSGTQFVYNFFWACSLYGSPKQIKLARLKSHTGQWDVSLCQIGP